MISHFQDLGMEDKAFSFDSLDLLERSEECFKKNFFEIFFGTVFAGKLFKKSYFLSENLIQNQSNQPSF